MHVPRLLPVSLSVLFAVGLWAYGAVRLQTNEVRPGGGYVTLVCGDGYSDREIRDRLDSRGLTGLVSESDQWALLDCFGGVEKIPLTEYEDRLLPFDPRNDGYAKKLKSLFVRDGKRFVYIRPGTNRQEDLGVKIAQALAGISYSLDYPLPSPGRDIRVPLMAFFLTACAFFVIPPLRRRLNAVILPCLIALSPLALGLAPGFALAALLAGFAALFSEPADREQPYGRQKGARDSPGPFTPRWLLALAIIACYVFLSFFWGLPVLFALFALASFCCALALSLKTGGGFSLNFNVNRSPALRRRFTPVEIISRRNTKKHSFFPVMLPFALMAIALAFAGFAWRQPPFPPAVNVSPLPPGAITEADFREHFLFQSSFSSRALGITYEAGALPPVIAGYKLSSNGLLEPAAPDIDEELQIPDFPLRDLLLGIKSDDVPLYPEDDGNHGNLADWLFAPMPMLFILPAFVYSVRRKRQDKFRTGFAGFYR